MLAAVATRAVVTARPSSVPPRSARGGAKGSNGAAALPSRWPGPSSCTRSTTSALAKARLDAHRVAFVISRATRCSRVHDEVSAHLSEQPPPRPAGRHRIELGRDDACAPARLGLHDRQNRRHDRRRSTGPRAFGAAREPQQLGHHAPHALHSVAGSPSTSSSRPRRWGSSSRPGGWIARREAIGSLIVGEPAASAPTVSMRAPCASSRSFSRSRRVRPRPRPGEPPRRLDARGGRHEAAHSSPVNRKANQLKPSAMPCRAGTSRGGQDVRQEAERQNPARGQRRALDAIAGCS